MGDSARGERPSWRQRLLRASAVILAYSLVVAAGAGLGEWLIDELGMELRPTTEPLLHRLIMTSVVAYVLLMALPFVPGVEIGLALIFLLGPEIVPLVYLATVAALLVAYTAGRLIPERLLAAGFAWLGLDRAAGLVAELGPLPPAARAERMAALAPKGMARRLLHHRHLAIGVALNIPGNSLIGGGGGIALATGMSGLVSMPAFLLTIAIATAPVPLAILLLDAGAAWLAPTLNP